jgi:hypothetical protein
MWSYLEIIVLGVSPASKTHVHLVKVLLPTEAETLPNAEERAPVPWTVKPPANECAHPHVGRPEGGSEE